MAVGGWTEVAVEVGVGVEVAVAVAVGPATGVPVGVGVNVAGSATVEVARCSCRRLPNKFTQEDIIHIDAFGGVHAQITLKSDQNPHLGLAGRSPRV